MTDDSSRGWIMDYPIYGITWPVLEFLSANDQLRFIISIEIGQISHVLVVQSQKFEILSNFGFGKELFLTKKSKFPWKKTQKFSNKEACYVYVFTFS